MVSMVLTLVQQFPSRDTSHLVVLAVRGGRRKSSAIWGVYTPGAAYVIQDPRQESGSATVYHKCISFQLPLMKYLVAQLEVRLSSNERFRERDPVRRSTTSDPHEIGPSRPTN